MGIDEKCRSKKARRVRKHQDPEDGSYYKYQGGGIMRFGSALLEAEHLYKIAVGFPQRMYWRKQIEKLTGGEVKSDR